MIVGAYTLDLYCDCCRPWDRHEKERNIRGPHPYQYVEHNLKRAMREAREDGWTFRKGQCRCPQCSAEARSFPKRVKETSR